MSVNIISGTVAQVKSQTLWVLPVDANGDALNFPSGGSIGDITNATNLGAGIGVFANKSGQDLQFYSISGTSGVTAQRTGNVIFISGTANGDVTGPASSDANELAFYADTTGKLLGSNTPFGITVDALNALKNVAKVSGAQAGTVAIVGDGGIELQTNTGVADILVNTLNLGNINLVSASGAVNLTAGTDVNIIATDDVVVTAVDALDLNATGNATLDAANVTITSNTGNTNIESDNGDVILVNSEFTEIDLIGPSITGFADASSAGYVYFVADAGIQGSSLLISGSLVRMTHGDPAGNAFLYLDTSESKLEKNGSGGTSSLSANTGKVDLVGTGIYPTVSGTASLGTQSIPFSGVASKQYITPLISGITTAATKTIDWNDGSSQIINFLGGVSGTCTITLSNALPGSSYVLQTINNTSGTTNLAWAANIKWQNQLSGVTTATNAAVDLFTFFYNGTNYLANAGYNYK